MLIGIAGGTGSGKSTFSERIQARFPEEILVLYRDNYYKPYAEIPFEERVKLNYDCPEAFDNLLFRRDLESLKRGETIEGPVYDYTHYIRLPETQTLVARPIILVEGILIFDDPTIRELFDLRIFVDTDADVRILRRMKRDVLERGRSIESIESQYLQTVKPMHERYVEPLKKYAHLIVPEGGYNEVALQMVIHTLEAVLRDGPEG